MKRALLGLVLLLGIGAGEYLTTDFTLRRWLGHIVGRGELEALVGRRGIYNRDVQRAGQSLESLIERAKLDAAGTRQPISSAAIDHQMDLLRRQFGDEKSWQAILQKAATTTRALRREVATSLRDRSWLEAQIAPNERGLRDFYDAHAERFQEPLRLRASHLFLAAPDGCHDEVIEAKRTLINALAARLQNGESFSALVAEFSEDEATKNRGGDLNYFAEARMLPPIWSAAQALYPGESSAPVRSRLGFHLIRLTESRPPRTLDFDEARPEISAALENEKRAQVVRALLAGIEVRVRRAY